MTGADYCGRRGHPRDRTSLARRESPHGRRHIHGTPSCSCPTRDLDTAVEDASPDAHVTLPPRVCVTVASWPPRASAVTNHARDDNQSLDAGPAKTRPSKLKPPDHDATSLPAVTPVDPQQGPLPANASAPYASKPSWFLLPALICQGARQWEGNKTEGQLGAA